MSVCTYDCVRPRGRQAHCAGCHYTFTGITAFDSHRKDFTCRHPSTIKMVEGPKGWHVPAPEGWAEKMHNKYWSKDTDSR